jgi:response regulator RpfG family c-di-GMP phosphodiesterase
MTDWPDDFDIRHDDETAQAVQGFIATHLTALRDYDAQREEWVKKNLPQDYVMTYRFHDHTLRVADDMRKTAMHLGLSETCAHHLYLAMLVHDVGKIKLPVKLWDMVDKPDDYIKNERRRHTGLGVDLIHKHLPQEHPMIELMVDITAYHHENMDGSGYLGLTGDDLSLPVRLACIIESFDGYATVRPHFGDRDVSPAGVIKRMREEKGAAIYDLELLEAFAAVKIMDYKDGNKM